MVNAINYIIKRMLNDILSLSVVLSLEVATTSALFLNSFINSESD